MGSVPLLRPREVIKAFERLGWEVARQRGSHIIIILVPKLSLGTQVDKKLGFEPALPWLMKNLLYLDKFPSQAWVLIAFPSSAWEREEYALLSALLV